MASDEEESGGWEETGAFPRVSSSPPATRRAHIFTDEPFDGDFNTLEVVNEGSSESEKNLPGGSIVAVSTTSSETRAMDNRRDSTVLRNLGSSQQYAPPSQYGSSQGDSPGASKYPFNIHESLGRLDEKKRRDVQQQEQPHREREAETQVNRRPPSNSKSANTSFASMSSSSNIGGYGQETLPSPLTQMTYGEETSVVSESQSNIIEPENNNMTTSQSVISATRSHQKSRRYMVRHTLSTTQQVNANPSAMLKNIFIGIEQERHMHKLAGQNLKAVHNWLMFVPCAALTLFSGLIVLIFEAELNVTDDARVYSSIAVGIASLLAVFLQAVSKMLDMGTRGSLHAITATTLKRLSEDIILTLSSTETVPSEYVALMSEKFGQALDSCPSPLPYKLEASFSAVSDRMVLMLKPPTGQPARKYVHKLDYMRLYSTVYDELNAEIIHSGAWPFMFPRPRSASEAALRNFKAIITEGREAVQRKQGLIRLCCPCAGENAIERSLFDVVPPASVADSSHTTAYHHPSSKHNVPSHQYPIRNSMLGQEV